uniref:Uncharacterized protein n=1 Tax=virus sp. ctBM815 TaxID=2825806 RepID=A0A8S5RK30_9VIRU|nr:MAG TPA: hypothetical protein [virus sp. ctBM815]
MKKAIKKTVKVKKPKYTIDMRDIDDVTADFISQKIMNGMKLTESDVSTIVSIVTDIVLKNLMPEDCSAIVNDGGVYRKCTAVRVENEVKKPWYKRAWNWVTRKK